MIKLIKVGVYRQKSDTNNDLETTKKTTQTITTKIAKQTKHTMIFVLPGSLPFQHESKGSSYIFKFSI
jgi:hypothetical protein